MVRVPRRPDSPLAASSSSTQLRLRLPPASLPSTTLTRRAPQPFRRRTTSVSAMDGCPPADEVDVRAVLVAHGYDPDSTDTAVIDSDAVSVAGDLVLTRDATLSARDVAARSGADLDKVLAIYHHVGVAGPRRRRHAVQRGRRRLRGRDAEGGRDRHHHRPHRRRRPAPCGGRVDRTHRRGRRGRLRPGARAGAAPPHGDGVRVRPGERRGQRVGARAGGEPRSGVPPPHAPGDHPTARHPAGREPARAGPAGDRVRRPRRVDRRCRPTSTRPSSAPRSAGSRRGRST